LTPGCSLEYIRIHDQNSRKEMPMPAHDRNDAELTAKWLLERLPSRPEVAVLTGTGLGRITGALSTEAVIDYARIPHFPLSTVQSHHGRLVAGRLAGRAVAVLQGRPHLYEGYSPVQVTFPVRVMQALGVHTLVVTNASGGLNPSFAAGRIMIVADHINLTGRNPLIGANDELWGARFPDMTTLYTPRLRDMAFTEAERLGLDVCSGVYVGLQGPSLETPAEMRFLRTIGADAVGFSTVMEAIAAAHAGMQVLGLSVITNLNTPDTPQPASVEAIIAVAQNTAPHLEKLIAGVIAEL
jgi:purine-nucleoside phosphorylase